MKACLFLICFFTIHFSVLNAQNTRLFTPNTVGWYNYFGTFNFNNKIGIHTEYQFRRSELVEESMQNLIRLGINYQLNPKIQLRIGYANIETEPYGEIPINSFGKSFTEHRAFQMAILTDKISKVDLSHRFMVEQRWVGKYTNPQLTKEDEYPILNRLRYMVRMQRPFKGGSIIDKTAYFAIYNEIFIGFGKNVNENIFDQNRLGVLFGYRFNKAFRIEAGYINQTLQLGREINNRNVFQKNNGIIINTNFTFDLSNTKFKH